MTSLHVITFHVPFPPNYGGAVDVYYKLKSLHEAGYKVILHTFLYDGEMKDELNEVCYKVYYYKRKQNILSHLTLNPYIVQSRKNSELLNNLLLDDHPILFEGLHSCYYLTENKLKNRIKYVRTHNVEHDYYHHLYVNSNWGIKKLYYYIESLKLKLYERVLNKADRILAISQSDYSYFKNTYNKKDIRLLRCFFDTSFENDSFGTDRFILYHGNLSVQENITAVLFIINEIIPLLPEDYKIIIAGRNPSSIISKEITKHKNAELISNPDNELLNRLISSARINLLLTFQPTGIKLKLLNTLVNGRGHCVVNKAMISGNDLADLCTVSDTKFEISESIKHLIDVIPSEDCLLNRRQAIFDMGYNDISPIIS